MLSGGATGGGLVNIQSGTGTTTVSSNVPGAITVSLSDTEGTGLIVSSSASVTFVHGPPVRFAMSDVADGSVDNTFPITITLEDSFGNLATTSSFDVTLRKSANAGFEDQIVSVTNGQGSATFTHTVPETITLSLLDTAGTSLDVSATQQVTVITGKRCLVPTFP